MPMRLSIPEGILPGTPQTTSSRPRKLGFRRGLIQGDLLERPATTGGTPGVSPKATRTSQSQLVADHVLK